MARPICIVVTHVYPPIPIRTFDWCAFEYGMEERGYYGYGRTRAEAVEELLQRFEDDAQSLE